MRGESCNLFFPVSVCSLHVLNEWRTDEGFHRKPKRLNRFHVGWRHEDYNHEWRSCVHVILVLTLPSPSRILPLFPYSPPPLSPFPLPLPLSPFPPPLPSHPFFSPSPLTLSPSSSPLTLSPLPPLPSHPSPSPVRQTRRSLLPSLLQNAGETVSKMEGTFMKM